jgi:hypothetical protein
MQRPCRIGAGVWRCVIVLVGDERADGWIGRNFYLTIGIEGPCYSGNPDGWTR